MRATDETEAGMRGLEQTVPPLTVRVLEPDGRIEVTDRGQRFAYELHFRGVGGRYSGPGWVELAPQPDGTIAPLGVTTAEVMAVLSDAGREEDAAAMTRAVALWFERAGDAFADRVAARLRDGVDAGYGRERLSVRALQARIVERLVDGETLVDMCERAGFKLPSGKADTSWIQRRAGFMPTRCSRTGKMRLARTASYDVFCALVRAIDAEPHEFGV